MTTYAGTYGSGVSPSADATMGGGGGSTNWGGYAALAGAAMSVYGAYTSAKEGKKNAQYQSEMAALNAQVSERRAETAEQAGNQRESYSDQAFGQLKSTQRNALSANGVDIGVGSARDILTSTDLSKEATANNIHAGAVADAWGYRLQGTSNTIMSNNYAADAAQMNPMMSAASTALTRSGSVASQWYQYNKGSNMPQYYG